MNGAKRFRREDLRTRSTFIPSPPNPSVDVEGIESPSSQGSSIVTGAVVAVLLVTFAFIVFVIALAVFR